MKRDWFVLLMMSILLTECQRSFGCHNVETDQTEKNTQTSDGPQEQNVTDFFADVKVERRKRSAAHQDVNVVQYFPRCIQAQLAVTDYSSRNWDGPVSYAVYHSSWYEEVDDVICIGVNHTVECWIQKLTSFVSGLSPVLLAAQRCVKEYTDFTSGRRNPTPRYPHGLHSGEASTCPAVDEEEYENEFRDALNGTTSELEFDSSVSRFSDVITFAKDDMICFSCDCSDLDDEENSYDIDDSTGCGDCWSTRIAVAIRPTSKLRRPAKKVTRKKAQLRKKPKPSNKTPVNKETKNQNVDAAKAPIPNSQPGESGSSQNSGNDPIPNPQPNGEGARQSTGNPRPRAVYVAPVGRTSSSNNRGQTGTSAPRNTQHARAVFVRPVGRTDVDSGKPSSITGTNQRQQPEIPRNTQRNTQIVQPVQKQQQGSSSRPPEEARTTATYYVSPLQRPSSTERPSLSIEPNQPQRHSNQRSATESKTTTRPPEVNRQRSASPASQRQGSPSRQDNMLPKQEKPGEDNTNKSTRPQNERREPRSTTNPPERRTRPSTSQQIGRPAGGNRQMRQSPRSPRPSPRGISIPLGIPRWLI